MVAAGVRVLSVDVYAAGLQQPNTAAGWAENGAIHSGTNSAEQTNNRGTAPTTNSAGVDASSPAIPDPTAGFRAVPDSSAAYPGPNHCLGGIPGHFFDRRADANLRQLAPRPGQPLSRIQLADSVRALYATGRFADLAVEAERHGSDQVDLVYRATPNYFVGVVTVAGAPGAPSNAQLADATRLRLGELYSRGEVDRGITLIREYFAKMGTIRRRLRCRSLPIPARSK